MIFQFTCLACRHRWTDNHAGPTTICRRCGNDYLTWDNYEQLRKAYYARSRSGQEAFAFGGSNA